MQQRQLRLGDILDDYCPRERRVTNHAVVAMVGEDVKQTRCTTCDTEHEYKHARVPRQRRKSEPAALYSQVVAGAPKRVAPGPAVDVPTPAAAPADDIDEVVAAPEEPRQASPEPAERFDEEAGERDEPVEATGEEEGPVHRPLIRATLPRPAGQTPERQRAIPEFTMRQPAGRPNRFRPRQGGGRQQVFGHAGGNVGARGGAPRPHGSRPGGGHPNRQRSGRKRSK